MAKAVVPIFSSANERIVNSIDQFETIVSEHYEALFRFAMNLTRSEADACDLTQQTFYVWAAKGHQLRDISKVRTWLFTTLHRAFIQLRRKASKYSHEELQDIPEQVSDSPPTCFDLIDASRVRSALAKVDEVHQAAVALFYLDDRSYKEIAATLEVPIGTVKSRIARGVAQLRKILLSDDSDPDRKFQTPSSKFQTPGGGV